MGAAPGVLWIVTAACGLDCCAPAAAGVSPGRHQFPRLLSRRALRPSAWPAPERPVPDAAGDLQMRSSEALAPGPGKPAFGAGAPATWPSPGTTHQTHSAPGARDAGVPASGDVRTPCAYSSPGDKSCGRPVRNRDRTPGKGASAVWPTQTSSAWMPANLHTPHAEYTGEEEPKNTPRTARQSGKPHQDALGTGGRTTPVTRASLAVGPLSPAILVTLLRRPRGCFRESAAAPG